MGIITAIEPQQRDKSRLNIFVDGVFVGGIDKFTALKNRLQTGSEISAEALDALRLEGDKQKAFDRGAEYLAIRYRSKKEVYDHLQSKGYLPVAAAYAVEKLCEYGYLDDRRFAAAYIAHYKKKYGQNKIRFQLKRMGVDEDIVYEALSGLEQRNEIEALAQKYFKTHRGAPAVKAASYLYGKGFGREEIDAALANVLKRGEEDDV